MTIQTPLQLVITIGIIALGTFLIRALPFFLFPAGKETPRVVAYLGAALPSASIAMLVVYCFKNVSVFSGSHGLPFFRRFCLHPVQRHCCRVRL